MFSAFLAVLLLAQSPMPTPQHLPTIVLHAPRAALRVQVAQTEHEREVGLMSVTSLPRHTGMLFVFDQDAPVSFWMKDTLISLDMVFVSSSGIVRKVFPSVPVVSPSLPDTDIPIEQGEGRFVIELPAGEAAKDGLVAGARVRGLPLHARTP